MKTNTTVPVADFLELYEFKKAYDEGKKVYVIPSDRYDKEYQIPMEEFTNVLDAKIQELDKKFYDLCSMEDLRADNDFMKNEVKKANLELEKKEGFIDTLILDSRTIKDRLKSSQKIVLYLTIAWVIAMIIILNLL